MRQRRKRMPAYVYKEETCPCPGRYETDAWGNYVLTDGGRRKYHHHPDCKPHDTRKANDPTPARKYLKRMGARSLFDVLEDVAS